MEVCKYRMRVRSRASELPLSFTASEEADKAIYTTLARTHARSHAQAQAQAQAQTRSHILYSKHDALETWTCGDCRRLLAVDVCPNASFRKPCVCPPPFPSEVSDSAMLAWDPCLETCPEIVPPPLFPPPLLAPRPFVRPACSHACMMRGQTCAWHTRMYSPLFSVAHAPAEPTVTDRQTDLKRLESEAGALEGLLSKSKPSAQLVHHVVCNVAIHFAPGYSTTINVT